MRLFRKIGNQLCSATREDQIETPSAVVGVFSDDEQLMRLFYRVYELGRKDAKAEIWNALHD